jgi:hypothetical protein
MRKEHFLAGALFALACGVAPRPEVAVSSGIVDRLAPSTTIPAADIANLPQVVDATYRLRPDRRFLLAVSDLVALNTGRRAPVEIDFVNGRWKVRCDGREAGDLPDIPAFADGMSMLTQWAVAVRPATSQTIPPATLTALDQDLDELTIGSLFRAAGRVDPSRGAVGLPAISRVARAVTLANLLAQEDHFGLADPLRARALALIAMARAADPASLAEEQAVMARLMRYDLEAAAATLPAESFARVWITGSGTPAPRNLLSDYVTAAVSLRGSRQPPTPKELKAWYARLGPRLLTLLLTKLDFETQHDVASDAAALLAADQEKEELEPDEALARFESALAGRATPLVSAVADRGVVESYYQALFYSALDAEFDFQFDGRASAESTSAFVSSLKPQSATARQVVSWMSSMVEARYGTKAAGSLRSIEQMGDLGGAKRAVLLQEIAGRIGETESAVRASADALFPRLDSRPEVLFRAADFAATIIGDPSRRDRYMEAVIERAPLVADYSMLAWYYRTVGDVEKLRALVDVSDAPVADRARALAHLSELGRVDDAFVDRRFDQLLAEAQYGSVYSIYTEVLNRRGDARRKEGVARRALAANPDGTPISAAYYASSLANALERQGRYEEAWTVVKPHIPIWSENIISAAVTLLQRLGRESEANELGRRLVERYPSSGRFELAPVLWREHHYADAARLFDPKELAVSHADWNRWMPEAFSSAFSNDIPGAVAALKALAATGLDPSLLQTLLRELLRQEKPLLAQAMAEELVETHPLSKRDPDAASYLILAYRARKASQGETAAIDWVRHRVTTDALLETIAIAYQESEYPLVVALKRPVPDASEQIQIGSCYAGALLSMHVPRSDPRWAQLAAETASQSAETNSVVDMTRHLLGESDLKTVAASHETRSTIEYFIGLKAAADGDYDRALAFLLAAARGSYAEPPPVWAATLLYRWSQQGRWSEVRARHDL